jgi:hypothetical protein
MAFLLDGSVWFGAGLPVALALALRAELANRDVGRRIIERILTKSYGALIAIMIAGHFTAISIRWEQGLVAESGRLVFLYGIGLLHLVPAAGLFFIARTHSGTPREKRWLAFFNIWLAIAFLVNTPSAPLAAPALLNLGALRAQKLRTLKIIMATSAFLYLLMWIAALVVDGKVA